MADRMLFSQDHDLFRDNVRRFIAAELAPHHAQWEEEGRVSRRAWTGAGEAGMLCPDVDPVYGGAGADFLFNVVVIEEMARAGITGPGYIIHSEMVAPYLVGFGTEEQKRGWLPGMVSGEIIGAVAMTEPSAGSDLKAIRTSAIRDGDDYLINGQKVYISNGQLANLMVVACKTDPAAGAKGVSLILVETDRPGFRRGRNLKKIGFKAQDTSEIFFDQVRVPASNLLGQENRGFQMLMTKLARERLCQAIRSTAAAEAAIGWTVDYTRERKAFDRTIAEFQNTRFKLAELATRTAAARCFVDDAIRRYLRDDLDSVDAAMAKLFCTDLHCDVVNECLQFFGGYGYMLEYPIARAYIDARITRIAGGAAEIMKQIIANRLYETK